MKPWTHWWCHVLGVAVIRMVFYVTPPGPLGPIRAPPSRELCWPSCEVVDGALGRAGCTRHGTLSANLNTAVACGVS